MTSITFLLFSFIIFFISLIFLIIGINARRPKYKRCYFPNVSVISWFWKDGNIIERKIKNFLSLNYPGKYEVIIIDNVSQDETRKICEKYAKKGLIKYYRTKKEYDRKAFGLDETIKKVAKYNILAMTDPDCISDKNWLTNLVQPLNDKKVGAVIGLTHCGNFYENFFTKLRAVEDEWSYVIFLLGTIFKNDIHFIYGANYAVKREALRKVGYHGKKTLGEDFELSIKLFNKGWDIKVSDANVWQEEVKNIRGYIRQRLRWQNSAIEVFNYYKKYFYKILKKRPFGLISFLIFYPIQLFSFLTLILIILGLLVSFNVFLLNFASFLILNIATIIGLVRFRRFHLIPYVPFYLVIEPFFVIYCQLLLRYLKFCKKKIVWRSLDKNYYHAGTRLILK
jgi:hyaluronan synthase